MCNEWCLNAFHAFMLRPGDGGGGLVDRQEWGQDKKDHAEETGDGGRQAGCLKIPETGYAIM